MKRQHAFDALIVAMTSLFAASCFTPAIYQQILHLLPLCLVYGITEIVMVSARQRHADEFGEDPQEPMRHRFCMLLYMHGITVADWRVAAVILPYAILARFATERGVVVVIHSLAMIGLAIVTVFVQPRGLAAWAPAITLVGILLFVAWSDRGSVGGTAS